MGSSTRRPIRTLSFAALVALGGCATTKTAATAQPTAATKPAERVEMEPLAIEVVGAGASKHVEAYDAATLFEQAGADLQAEKWDAAVAGYDRVVEKFPSSRYVASSLYNAGLASEGKKDWAGAVAHYRTLVDKQPATRDALDALFRMGQCLAEMGNWAASAQAFKQVLEHPDLTVEDRIESTARVGLAQYQMKDLFAAEKTFREALQLYREHEALERIDNVFYVAMSQYYLAEIAHDQFRAMPLRMPARQMKQDLDEKARQLLLAQARYLDVARLRNPAWATAAGYQMASLYKEMYDAVMDAPAPKMPEEERQMYIEELRKTLEPLLRKAIHAHELTQQVAERNGVDNEWVRKSSEQLEQLKALVTPETPAAPSSEGAPSEAPRPPKLKASPALEKMQPPPSPPMRDEEPRRAIL